MGTMGCGESLRPQRGEGQRRGERWGGKHWLVPLKWWMPAVVAALTQPRAFSPKCHFTVPQTEVEAPAVNGGCRCRDSPWASTSSAFLLPLPVQQTEGCLKEPRQTNANQLIPMCWLLKFVGITSNRQTVLLCARGAAPGACFTPPEGSRSSRYLRMGPICLLKSLLYFSFGCLALLLCKKSLELPWKIEWLLVIFGNTFLVQPIWAWLGFTNRLQTDGVLGLEFKMLIESKTLTGEMDAQSPNYSSLPFSLYVQLKENRRAWCVAECHISIQETDTTLPQWFI